MNNFEPGSTKKSIAKVFGHKLKEQAEQDSSFYLFSPDETTSNKLDEIYQATTRAWGVSLPKKKWDLPESPDGRIIELLSENVLFSVMIGHLLSNEPAMMTSYEAFFTIILSQIIQHLKFLEQSEEVSWRPQYPSVNLLSTSTCWRQDHNGFSHQSPMLISSLLDRPGHHVNCFFPVDASSVAPCFDFLMQSKNQVNLVTFNKTEEPIWQTESEAKQNFEMGYSLFEFISNKNSSGEFDHLFVAAGDIATREAIEAIKILRQDLPEMYFGLINISALTYGAIGTSDRPLSQSDFDQLFGQTALITANFHGYPNTLTDILSNYTDKKRIKSHGFEEQGSTVTPFAMLTMNHASRLHLALDVAISLDRPDLIEKYQKQLEFYEAYALEHGIDHPELGIDN